jgi:hypothetical protein
VRWLAGRCCLQAVFTEEAAKAAAEEDCERLWGEVGELRRQLECAHAEGSEHAAAAAAEVERHSAKKSQALQRKLDVRCPGRLG